MILSSEWKSISWTDYKIKNWLTLVITFQKQDKSMADSSIEVKIKKGGEFE